MIGRLVGEEILYDYNPECECGQDEGWVWVGCFCRLIVEVLLGGSHWYRIQL